MSMLLASPKALGRARWALVPVFMLAFALPVFGQTLYGSLVGTVTDGSGLSVPGATVKITQAETNQSREATTNGLGAYSFPNIATGTYEVDVTLAGFQSFKSRGIIVQQNAAMRVDAKLSVGALQETVIVSGTAVVLQTESAAVQSRTTSEQLESLPTSGRSYQSFMTLMPGVAAPYSVQAGGINNPARSMGVSVNGQPPMQTVFRVDGATATNQWYPDLQSYSPALESVESVSVVTNSFDADQGMAGGAAVNVQVKSGTNTLHGSSFEYLLDTRLRARPYFLPSTTGKGQDQKNVYGGTIGGPIVHNKLFYFFSLEVEHRGTKNATVALGEGESSNGTTGLNSLPPAALRAGDFSGSGTVIYDPATGTATGTGRIPFAFQNCPGMSSTSDPGFAACNFIPANRISPISKAMLDKLILPTGPGILDNYFALATFVSDVAKMDSKVTWAAGNKLNVNGRISYLRNHENSHGIYPSVDGAQYNPLSIGRLWQAKVASRSVGATSILAPNLVVDGVWGYTPSHSWVEPEGPKDCWGDAFAIPHACQLPYSRDRQTPSISNGFSMVTPSQFRDYDDSQMQWSGNVGWTRGTHNVKFGFDINRMHVDHYQTAANSFTFGGGATSLSGGTAPNTFNSFAAFLLGLPTSRSSQIMLPLLDPSKGKSSTLPATLRTMADGLYLRDQWQLSRKMTASAGLRWEYYPWPVRADRGLETFDFSTNKMQICGTPGSNAALCDVKVQKDLFTPRLGWAYRPTESIVVRVGFSRNPQSDNVVGRDGGTVQTFPQIVAITETGANSFTPVGTFSTGVPVVPVLDLSSGTVSLPAGSGVNTMRGEYVRGTITSWNLTLQKLLPHAMNVTVGYVANRQNNMTRSQNLNYGTIGGGAASQAFNQLGLADGLRTTSGMNVYLWDGRVTYDSLQASLTRRMTNGLQFTSAYTFASSYNWQAGGISIPEYQYLNKAVQGGGGRSSSSTPHKVDLSAIYELPFGKGKPFLNDGLLAHLFGRWQLSSSMTAYTGFPFTVSSSGASLNAPGNSQNADQVKDTVELNGAFTPGPQTSYFDVLAFKPVTEVRFGTAKYNSLRGPGVFNLDMSLVKSLSLSKSFNMQLKIEGFNITNTPHFGQPGSNVSNLVLNADGTVRDLGGFGVINDTLNVGREFPERYVRVGLRIAF
jgi:hypothetical protein